MTKIMTFLKEVKLEMKKVTWPNKKETINYTVIVVVLSFLTIIFLGGFDFLLAQLRNLIIK